MNHSISRMATLAMTALLFQSTQANSLEPSRSSAADERWVRVMLSDPQATRAISDPFIDYGTFLWGPASDLSDTLRAAASQINTVSRPFDLHLDQARLDPAQGWPESDWTQPRAVTGRDFRLVQFTGPIRKQWLDQLKANGVTPVQYLHPFTYIVWSDQASAQRAASASAVRWQGEMVNAFRVPESHRGLDESMVPAMALVHSDAVAGLQADLNNRPGQVVSQTRLTPHITLIGLELAGSNFARTVSLPGIMTLQQIQPGGGPRSEVSQQSIVGNYDAGNIIQTGYADWLADAGLDGSGVVVGIVDEGIFEQHPDLTDNMLPCTGPGASCGTAANPHGTHVAGAVAGNASSGVTDSAGFLRGQGVAPGASLVEQLFPPLLGSGPGGMDPEGMLIIYLDSARSGAVLTNNSWGPTVVPQGYDIPTMEIDFITRDADPETAGAQPVLPVWSIMNGNGDRNLGICAPSSLASPDEAKNLFAVGSTRLFESGAPTPNLFDLSSNSAHGPACDGRLVPHIVAPGCRTDSPNSASGYGFLCGTSMASPVVSGSVSLFIEQYRTEQQTDPSPALIKAVFSAIAMNLQGFNDADSNTIEQRPNRTQGWGRLDLDAVINPTAAVMMIDQTEVFDNTGDQFEITLPPADPLQPVRMMLVWTDAPGSGMGGTTPAWVNDLDLVVSDTATTWLGNDFDTDGFAATGGSADGMNNMEAVFLKPDQHSGQALTVTITASNLAADALNPWEPGDPAQDFALVCYNCAEAVDTGLVFEDDFEN